MQAIEFLVRNKFFILLLSMLVVPAFAKTEWQSVAPGLSYTTVSLPHINSWATVHAFRIDLQKIPLQIALARDFQKTAMSATQFAEASQAILAVNGGFFDHQSAPMGLRIQNQKTVNPIKSISWWGVFGIRHGLPFINSLAEFRLQPNADLAVQAGPRLVVDGEVVSHLKPGVAERTGVGITANNEVIIAVTDSTPLSLNDFAEVFQESEANDGLEARMALNLDGGGSTQLFAKLPDGDLNLTGFSQVSDALIIPGH